MPRLLSQLPAARLPAAAAVCFVLAPLPALANDSEAEWAVGGLALKANDAVSMDREELFISSEEVRVDYTYTNHSDDPQTVLVSFPLPALPGQDQEWVEYGSWPDWSRLGFSTTIDGKPAEWQTVVRAVAGGKDVTALVEAEGFPLEWYQDYDFVERIAALPEAEAGRLAAKGLLVKEEGWGGNDYGPAWQVQWHITRQQTFPAHATVNVSHRYTPIIGGSVGGLLDQLDDPQWADQKAHYRERFCTDDAFLAGVKKRQRAEQARAGEDYSYYGETWIGYVLSSGANWRGPIKDFRLVVDKGRPDNLVSFCMDGVKKITPTQFEIRKTGYEPDRDLDILIVQWYEPEE